MLEAPTSVNRDVRRLLTHLRLPAENVHFLDVRAQGGATQLECFENVRLCILERGGTAAHGWLVWLWPNVLVEAEFHCVWQSPDGGFEDVTPRPDGDMKVLFVTDPPRAYAGVSVDNVRIPLRDDKLVRDFIRCFELRFEVLNRGERANQHGLISVPEAEIQSILELAALAEAMLRQGLRDHSRCICGTGRKYKKCHGRLL